MTIQEFSDNKIREFEEMYGFYEIYVCADCKHTKEDHYWNGGGRIEASGYDRCRNGDCKCVSENWEIKKVPEENKEIKSFLRTAIKEAMLATLEEVRNLVDTHTEKEGGYCDTGGDMEWACRSKCVELALKRLAKKKEEIREGIGGK